MYDVAVPIHHATVVFAISWSPCDQQFLTSAGQQFPTDRLKT